MHLEVLDEDFNKDRIKIAFNPLATDSDKRFAVQDASHLKDRKWISDISEVFKNNFDPFDFVFKYCEDNPKVKHNEVNNAIIKLKEIANRQIGVIELDHSLDIDEVTEIFIRINSKGTALSQSDFVMSKMAADTAHGGNTLRLKRQNMHIISSGLLRIMRTFMFRIIMICFVLHLCIVLIVRNCLI